MKLRRVYVRCVDCLSVSVVEVESASDGEALRTARGGCGECGLCHGPIEVMGVVALDRIWGATEEVAVCNEKCVDAAGPNCSCHCGGANHGSGLTREVLRRGSSVPRITPKERTPEKAAALLARVAAFRRAYRQLYTLPVMVAKRKRQWLSNADYYAVYWIGLHLDEARSARTWAKRERCIADAEKAAGDHLENHRRGLALASEESA